MAEKTTQTEKIGGPAIGNALAFFLVPILASAGWIEVDTADPKSLAMGVAMGGAVIAWLLLQIRTGIMWAARLIERRANRL